MAAWCAWCAAREGTLSSAASLVEEMDADETTDDAAAMESAKSQRLEGEDEEPHWHMHRLRSGPNEVLVMEALLDGEPVLFQIDTGYAGPPVLSKSYMAYTYGGSHATLRDRTVAQRFEHAMKHVRGDAARRQRHAHVDRFVQRAGCHTYTSGCTMRLMSIGAVVEQQADMMLCPALRFQAARGGWLAPKRVFEIGAIGDVFVTNPLPHSVHILTSDYLFQMAPCALELGRERVGFRLSADALRRWATREGYREYPIRLAGGSIVIDIVVGGTRFALTMDTGAPGPVSLGRRAKGRFACKTADRSVQQLGVNNERICSSVMIADVTFADRSFGEVPVLLNDHDVHGVDGYVGLGILRCFDILIQRDRIGFAPSGLSPRRASEFGASGSGNCVSHRGACRRSDVAR